MLVYRGAITGAEEARQFEKLQGTAAEVTVLKFVGTLPLRLDDSVRAQAQVRQGRWLVECPWCYGAELASAEDHRFFCCECRNAAVRGAWIPVDWPEDADAIAELLAARAHPHSRNWLAHETAADLLAENLEHGVK